MALSDLIARAKDMVQKRGGTDSLKEDAQELKDIATSEGSMSDKVKKGAEAIKEPGAKGPEPGAAEPGPGAGAAEPGPGAGAAEPGRGPDSPGPGGQEPGR